MSQVGVLRLIARLNIFRFRQDRETAILMEAVQY